MMLESTFNILMIANSIATDDPYAYFELDQSYVVRAILPMWMTMFVGGFLHLVAWGQERRKEPKRQRHNTTLCWTARILYLVVGLAAFSYGALVECGHDTDWFTFVWPLALLVVPCILAWWWHLAGSLLLTALACFLAISACSSDLDRGYALGYLLPLAIAFSACAFMHLMVGVWELEANRGGRQGQQSDAAGT
jgi:hypothetical protein